MDPWSQAVVRRALSWPLTQQELTPEPETVVCTCRRAEHDDTGELESDANGELQLPIREEHDQDECSQLPPGDARPSNNISASEIASNSTNTSGTTSNNIRVRSATTVSPVSTNQTRSSRPTRTPSAPPAPDGTTRQRPGSLGRQGSAPVPRSRLPSLFSPGLLSEENSHASHVSHASHLSSQRPGATGENARRFPTIYLHYYPEAGWGWVVATCALLVQLTLVGLYAGAGLVLLLAGDRFPQIPPQELGEYHRTGWV